jgi:hypothetical protein
LKRAAAQAQAIQRVNVVCIPRHSASTRCSTCAYLEQHGKPVAFYSDKHGIFRVNSKDAVGAFGTLQDRLVKELRLAGVSSITAHNTRFGRDPANAKDLHRALSR